MLVRYSDSAHLCLYRRKNFKQPHELMPVLLKLLHSSHIYKCKQDATCLSSLSISSLCGGFLPIFAAGSSTLSKDDIDV